MTLKVGRVGFTSPTISTFTDWRIRGQERGSRHRVSGWIEGQSSLADAKALRQELVYQSGKLIAVASSDDDQLDGFYIQRGADLDIRAGLASLQSVGKFPFDLDLEFVGNHSSVEFLSNLTGLLVTNDHGMAAGEVSFAHAPPVAGDDSYTAGGGTSAVERTTEDGDIPVFTGITVTNGLAAARWGCSPANFYKGAARIDIDGYTRTGLHAPMTPAAIVMGNGLIEFRLEASGGASIGDIGVRGYNSGWGSWIPFDVVWNSTTDIQKWHFSNIVRNTGAVTTIRLVRDADEAPPTDNRHILDVTLRRGFPFVSCHYSYSSAVALTVDRASTDAATAVTPTGGTSDMAVHDASDDGDSNRWVLAASDVATADTTNGGIDMASSTTHDFMVGIEINGSSGDTEDKTDALCQQYLAQMFERVQAVVR